MKRKTLLRGLVACLPLLAPVIASLLTPSTACAQNGTIDGIEELIERQTIMVPMADGVELATDIYRPILQDDIGYKNFPLDLGFVQLIVPELVLARRGLAYVQYPEQANPSQLPMVFTRSPYNKQDPSGGYIFGLLGYAFANQDMRGRYASEGVYLPMYSDSWNKNPYFSGKHTLDSSPDGEANSHEDGLQSLQFLINDLRFDATGVGILTPDAPLLSNGKVGMFGASALANSQFQAALAAPIDPNGRGLKCLFPTVGAAEFSQSAGHPNGVFREALIDGWLRGQIESYPYLNDAPANLTDGVHSLKDFGPDFTNRQQVAERAIDFWTTEANATDPNSAFRAIMDASHAPLNTTGAADPEGTVSRYRNMQVPVFHVSGWWDIFVDGQIDTWSKSLAEAQPQLKGMHKLVIGPWAHQTIGNRSTGDMSLQGGGQDFRYPENVLNIINTDLDGISPDQIIQLLTSEPAQWFQSNLGEPRIILPPNPGWQLLGNIMGNEVSVVIPADTLNLSFREFFNFINGAEGITVPVRVKGFALFDSTQITPLDVPATGVSLLGDPNLTRIEETAKKNFDGTQPDGVPNVRVYVVGPVADPQNQGVGNYWYAADTFPLPDTQNETLFLGANGSIGTDLPTAAEGMHNFVADPDSPVPTHGGANMLVDVPGGGRRSQGQMNFADPAFREQVLDRPAVYSDAAGSYSDLISFQTDPLNDTLSIAGIPSATLFAATQSIDHPELTELNAEFVVRVLDVYPDGRELFVFEGAVNARARAFAASRVEGEEDPNLSFENITANEVYEYSFLMLPIAYTWGRGHSLKVLISGSNYPRYQSCPNIPLAAGDFFRRPLGSDKTYNYDGVPYSSQRVMQTLHFSSERPSALHLPVLGGSTPTSRATASGAAAPALRLRAWPQPTDGPLSVELRGGGLCDYTLLDLNGRTVASGSFDEKTTLSVESLPAGVYALRVLDSRGGQYGLKVIR